MPLILGANSVSGGYKVDNSLRFNSGSSDYLNRTPASAGNRQKLTYSFWVKKSDLTSGNDNTFFSAGTSGSALDEIIFVTNGGTLRFYSYSGSFTLHFITTQLFRDISAWYHFVIAVDTTLATAGDRVKIYVNGNQITSFSTQTNPSQNANLFTNNNNAHYISSQLSSSQFFNGYISEFYLIDGSQLTPTSFGETDEDSGIWKPKAYTGSFGTNGFYLQFKNSGALGTDSSGNGNTFTVNNLTSIDQTTDTPTNNFATLNSLIPHATPILYKDGNTIAFDSSANFNTAFSSIGISQGKWYFEAKTSTNNGFVGICKSDGIFPAYTAGVYLGHANLGTNSWGYYADSGNYFHNGSSTAYGNTWTNTDMIGCALDLDNNKLYFSKNGTFQNSGVPTSGATGTGAISITSGTYLFGVTKDNESSEMLCNFGNPAFTISSGNADANGYGNFEYAVPSGYFALCTKNLAEYA